MASLYVEHISKCYIKPKYELENSNKFHFLGIVDLCMLFSHYMQNGLLFRKPSTSSLNYQHFSAPKFVESLKNSLSLALVHFYPLAGQLATKFDDENQNCLVYVDCNKGLGARFIHASLQLTVDSILSPVDVPKVIESFFDLNGAINHDGHSQTLLSIQVTELIDGIFIGCSMNHTVADGTAFWNFWNVWSAIHMNANNDSNLPVISNYLGDGDSQAIRLPFTHPDQFAAPRYEATDDQLRKRIYNFSSESIAKLKARVNHEANMKEISSLQALSALACKSIAQSKDLPHDQAINLIFIANNRHRLNPPLPKQLFGNHFNMIEKSINAGELQANNLGWIASLLHQSIVNYNDKVIHDFEKEWLEAPYIPHLDTVVQPNYISVGQSPRFDIYGNEFGIGKPIAVRSGFGHKFAGVTSAYPGYEGNGSIELEICLPHDLLTALAANEEFMEWVTTTQHLD